MVVAVGVAADVRREVLGFEVGDTESQPFRTTFLGSDIPERLTSEGSYAAFCGTSPTAASSGKTQRRRLNRGVDRQANAAIYRIVITRLRWDARTQEYLQRRLSEGKTRREAIRCLKRYVARELFIRIQLANAPAGKATITS